MNDLYYTFQTTGSVNKSDSFQLFLDSKGNIVNNNNLEYGVYNKIISINIQKLLFIKVKKVGLGDVIDFITKITGLKKLIVFLTKGNCGCEARRVKFNKIQIIYWAAIKTRSLYDVDYSIVQKNKNLFFKKLKEKTELLNFTKKDTTTTNVKTYSNVQPISHEKIKKSCGCGKTKKG